MSDQAMRDQIASLNRQVALMAAEIRHLRGLAAGASSSREDSDVLDWLGDGSGFDVNISNFGSEPLPWEGRCRSRADRTMIRRIQGPTFRSVVLALKAAMVR